jgi:hypothetical protein
MYTVYRFRVAFLLSVFYHVPLISSIKYGPTNRHLLATLYTMHDFRNGG